MKFYPQSRPYKFFLREVASETQSALCFTVMMDKITDLSNPPYFNFQILCALHSKAE